MQNLFINIDIAMNVWLYVCMYIRSNLSKQNGETRIITRAEKFFINQGIKEVGFLICLAQPGRNMKVLL